MAFDHEKRVAMRMLDAVENATLSTADTRPLYEEADPALVYLLLSWLRARYGAGHSASEGVLGRIVELLQSSPTVASHARKGEKDSISQWFEDTHEYREFDRQGFIDLIVDKLES